MKVLVGSTGLIGSVLREQTGFDYCFNSQNIEELPTVCPYIDSLYLACLPAAKWKVNQQPLVDLENIINIVSVLQRAQARKVFVYSTIDVYLHSPLLVDERYFPRMNGVDYGSNRFLFEMLVRPLSSKEVTIIRLPALFHRLIKKNILFDLINDNNIDKINGNSFYQWYNLNHLWEDTQNAPANRVINLFPEPLDTTLLVKECFPEYIDKVNYGQAVRYDYRTIFSPTGYICDAQSSLEAIKEFVNEARN